MYKYVEGLCGARYGEGCLTIL